MNALEEEALARYHEAAEALEDGDATAAAACYARIVAILDELGHDVENDEGSLTLELALTNLAVINREHNWPEMVKITTRLVEHVPLAARAWVQHAIALKHNQQEKNAREAVDRAIQVDPEYSSAHYERACILAVAGEIDDALKSVAEAMEQGANPEHMQADDELKSLFSDDRFKELTGPKNYLACARRRFVTIVAKLPAFPKKSEHEWLDADTIDLIEGALPIVRLLLEESGIGALPRRDNEIDPADLTEDHRELLEVLVGAEDLWHALPFLLVLQDFGLPSLSHEDARLRLGLFGKPDPWVNALRSIPDPEAMLSLAEQVIARHPHIAELWMDKAVALLWMERAAEALPAIDHALTLDGEVAFFHLNRAYILNQLSRFEEAVQSIARAITLDSNIKKHVAEDPILEELRKRADLQALLS